MITATIRRERGTGKPFLVIAGQTHIPRAYMYRYTRPAEPTDADCVALVAGYPQPLRIVR